MKRATRTPNRFIISIQSWPVKALAFLLVLVLFNSCQDEFEGIGSKKTTSRFKVYYREFDIPVTTVQTDSLNSSVTASERLLCGIANDPLFGKTTAVAYTQFGSGGKIGLTNKSNFHVVSVDMKVVLGLDYYEYGDTTNANLLYTLHPITDPDFNYYNGNSYVSNSDVAHEATEVATGTFVYDRSKFKSHRALNTDATTDNNTFDTLYFNLDPTVFGQKLLDTALATGVYSFRNTAKEWAYDITRTDSVFRRAFPGFVIKPGAGNNRILAFKTSYTQTVQSTRITLRYTYDESGAQKTGILYYFNTGGSAFTKVTTDRANTALQDLNQANTDFSAPDDYCYIQAGTGLYAKLDIRDVRSYFDATPVDTLANVVLNGAELVINLEPDATRKHMKRADYVQLRLIADDNRFLKVPAVQSGTSVIADPKYISAYYSATGSITRNRAFLDPAMDGSINTRATLALTKKVSEQYYSVFLTDFYARFLKPNKDVDGLEYIALIPSAKTGLSAPYGKSFDGVSFKKDKVKLRIYYTKAL